MHKRECDAACAFFDGDGVDERAQRMLGCTVGRVAGQWQEARHRAHRDNVAAAVLHPPHRFESAVHGAEEIHVGHLPVLVTGEIARPPGVNHPGVVHQDVHRAELPFHLLEERGPCVFIADIVL